MYNGTGDNRGDDQKHRKIILMTIQNIACVCVSVCISMGKWPKIFYICTHISKQQELLYTRKPETKQ